MSKNSNVIKTEGENPPKVGLSDVDEAEKMDESKSCLNEPAIQTANQNFNVDVANKIEDYRNAADSSKSSIDGKEENMIEKYVKKLEEKDDKFINKPKFISYKKPKKQIDGLIKWTGETWSCTVCGKIADPQNKLHGKSNLKRHTEIHVDGMSFLCYNCGKSFKNSNSHKTHMYRCVKIQDKTNIF